jgi:hypothetical protein
MSRNRWRFSKPTIAVGIFALAVGLLAALTALIAGGPATGPGTGLVDDWTHHHLVFSNPGTAADALAQGRVEQWSRIVNDPRYIMQQMKRNPEQRALAAAPDFVTLAARLSAPFGGREPIGPIRWRREAQTLKRDWSMNLGGVGASQTGTFTASSGTGTVTVDGVTLTASPGTAASQSTTINTNGFTSGSTITITNPLNSSSLQLIASTPVAEEAQLQFTGSPLPNDNVKIVGITYEFETPPWTSGSMSANTCYIAIGTTINMVSWLASAITTGSANTGATTSTWQCGTTASQGASGVTVTSSTSPNVDVTGKITGSGNNFSKSVNTSAITFTVLINSSDGSTTSPYFVWSLDNVAVSQAQVATNIISAIGSANAVGVGATSGGSGIVVITATLTGLAGRSILVATSISPGDLSGGKFAGDLTGGGPGTTSGATFLTSTDSTTQSTNLANEAAALASAIITNVSALTASSAGAVVTVTDKTVGTGGDSIALSGTVGTTFSWAGATLANGGATVGAGMYPAKYSFSTTAAGLCATSSTPDYVVYNTGVPGSTTSGSEQANIIAYDNIYTGCSVTSVPVPNVYWSYYTGTGSVVTSPVLSGDGTKVAFIETPSSGAAVLRILKWVRGQGTDFSAPVAPTNLYTTGTAWSTCPSGQSCMISVAFQSPAANPDTASSPFYDYPSDTIYVGDSAGYLHKFTGVFLGTPGEVTGGGTTSGWPQQISTTNALSSAVYDANFKCGQTNCSGGTVFVGMSGPGSLRYLYSIAGVGGSSNITESSTAVSTAYPTGYADGPVVDPSAGKVYAFTTDDATGGEAGVYQFPESLASDIEAYVGNIQVSGTLFSGTFDNDYFTSSSGALWVCGNSSTYPTLYPIPISSGTMSSGSITAGPEVSSQGGATCSPVTEFCATTTGVACSAGADTSTSTSPHQTDYIFVSPQTQSVTGIQSCTANEGCVLSYTITTARAATYSGSGAFPGGASGMIVDTQNTSGSLTTLQLYFGILGSESCTGTTTPVAAGSGTGGCAIQASEATLSH